mmetsp:Transcript_35030/g.58702  ORF Transcript_35030/g.58702 Transcript_35030/m.58702 type:complete len:237 (+) Transcript_35030:200-910(+)
MEDLQCRPVLCGVCEPLRFGVRHPQGWYRQRHRRCQAWEIRVYELEIDHGLLLHGDQATLNSGCHSRSSESSQRHPVLVQQSIHVLGISPNHLPFLVHDHCLPDASLPTGRQAASNFNHTDLCWLIWYGTMHPHVKAGSDRWAPGNITFWVLCTMQFVCTIFANFPPIYSFLYVSRPQYTVRMTQSGILLCPLTQQQRMAVVSEFLQYLLSVFNAVSIVVQVPYSTLILQYHYKLY